MIVIEMTFLILQLVVLLAIAFGSLALLFRRITGRREKPENLNQIRPLVEPDHVGLDIVAVYGLGAHPEYTWMAEPPSGGTPSEKINWLSHKDFLTRDFRGARVLLWAYNADWFMDASLSRAPDKASTFIRALSEYRQRTQKTPPIIFIGHSFGGILVKYAVVEAQGNSDISKSSNAMLLKLLSFGSQVLLDLRKSFAKAIERSEKRLKVFSFFEAKQTVRFGISLGPIVDEDSATLGFGEHIEVNTDHSGLNKCKTRDGQLYKEIKAAISEIRSTSQQEWEAIAKWIIRYDDPGRVYQHQRDHSRARGKLQGYENIGMWLIESPEFESWNESKSACPTFWLRGGVGTGKTSVTSEVVEWFHNNNWKGKLVHIYCTADFDLDSIYRSLVLQLSTMIHERTMQPIITSQYNSRDPDQVLVLGLNLLDLLVQLCDIHTEIIIIVDALDECPNPKTLLETLKSVLQKVQITTPSKIKLFVSSRLHVEIDRIFPEHHVFTIDANVASADMDWYITNEVDKHWKHITVPGLIDIDYETKPKGNPKDRLIRGLVKNAAGCFRWVELQLDIFFNEDYAIEMNDDLESELETLESGKSMNGISGTQKEKLNQAYHHLLNHRRKNARNTIAFALKWVLCWAYDVDSECLVEAINLSRERDQQKPISLETVRQLCSNILIIQDAGSVKFSHHSVKEYLENKDYCKDEFFAEECHANAAETCLWYIYRRNLISEVLEEYIFRNALTHWSRAGSHNRQRDDLIHSFINDPGKIMDYEHLLFHRIQIYERGGHHYLRIPYSRTGSFGESYSISILSPEPYITARAFLAACNFNLHDILMDSLEIGVADSDTQQLLMVDGIEIACICDCYDVAKVLLDKMGLKGALAWKYKNAPTLAARHSSGNFVNLILQYLSPTANEPDLCRMTIAAMGNEMFAPQVIKLVHGNRSEYDEIGDNLTLSGLLLNEIPASIVTDENIALLAAGHGVPFGFDFISVLLRSRTGIPITENILVAIAQNEENTYQYQLTRALISYNDTTMQLSSEFFSSIVEELLPTTLDCLLQIQRSRGGLNEPPTELVIDAVSRAKNEIIPIFLKYWPDIPMTEKIIAAAASNKYGSHKVIESLFNHNPNIPITENVLVVVAGNMDTWPEPMEFLLEHAPHIDITPRILVAAAANKAKAHKLLPLLLTRIPEKYAEESILEIAPDIAEFPLELLKWLLDRSSNAERMLEAAINNVDFPREFISMVLTGENDIHVGCRIMEAAAKHEMADDLILLLLSYDRNVQTGEGVLKAAASNPIMRAGTLNLLFERASNPAITDSMLDTAARNISAAALGVFLDRLDDARITDELLEHLIELVVRYTNLFEVPEGFSWEAMKPLLDIYNTKPHVPETIINIATANNTYALWHFLDSGRNITITEEVLIRSFRSEWPPFRILTDSIDYKVTEAVIEAAIENQYVLSADIVYLLDRAAVNITNSMLKLAAKFDNPAQELVERLSEYQNGLDFRNVLHVAMQNDRTTREMFDIILSKEDTQITEYIVLAAAQSSGECMKALLGCGRPIRINQKMLKALVSNEDWVVFTILQVILFAELDLGFTEEVIEAARNNKTLGRDLTKLLQTQAHMMGSSPNLQLDVIWATSTPCFGFIQGKPIMNQV
ncbi:hypothetical protein F5Y04DRAFT_171762 [Hypomontagnella monticulosa]|nr:hypothetical protein F5Y04DRAFT_171762 [Hypomontagnella monticulosa]